ncbi:MAG: S8 family serine peptidase [candidate division Zixibacteria bacterium]|nr:S8 family serine peptidase [candidate division Zixibacteria bacterium]
MTYIWHSFKRFVSLSAASLLIMNSAFSADLDFAVKLTTGEFTPQPVKTVPSAIAASASGKHLLIQFERALDEQDKIQLEAQGIVLLDYVPNFAFTAVLTRSLSQRDVESNDIRWIGEIQPIQKISPLISENQIPQQARRGGDSLQFAIVLHRDQNLQQWSAKFEQEFGAQILGVESSTNVIELVLPEQAIYRLSELDEVLWIEPAMPEPQEHNDGVRTNLGASVTQASPYNLTGAGVMLAEWDGGRADVSHADFAGRVISADGAAFATHATHVAGTVLGSGQQSGGAYKGVAPGAQMLTQLWWNSASEASNEYSDAILSNGAEISTNSWGYGVSDPATESSCQNTLGNYFSVSSTIDNIVRGSSGAPISICWSAGNMRGTSTQYCGSIGWTYNTVSPPGTGKNLITVGAINSNSSSMTSFSSWGPCDDGRIKPDVVGPGCQSNGDGGVTSTSLGNGYATLCGTSMSAPAVAGMLALMKEQWNIKIGSGTILPSTIKGILINTAIDLGSVGPDFQNGHGKVDGVKAVNKIGIGSPSYVEGQISTGVTNLYDLTVPSGTAKLKVTIVWDDPGGSGFAGKNLINDLDLTLLSPSNAATQSWILNPAIPSTAATRGIDRTNNVETVEINNPAPGLWKAKIDGFNIPTGPQKYSLIFTPDSIHTPGSLSAVEVFDAGDLSANPGATGTAQFWVKNIGASPDSVRVRISDNLNWSAAVVDSVILLSPFDSSLFGQLINIPPGTLAGTGSTVTCRANSLSDTLVQAQRQTLVSANAVYSLLLSEEPAEDTTTSPSSFPFTIKLQNISNSSDNITVTPSVIAGWSFAPPSRIIQLGINADSIVSFTAQVPPEVSHLSSNQITIIATSSDNSAADSASFSLVVTNPVFPPVLESPDSTIYTKNGVQSFAWSAAGDNYSLYVATDNLFNNTVRTYTGLATTNFSMPSVDSLSDGHYFWGVRTFVGPDSSSLQAVPRSLHIDNVSPLSANTVSPPSGAVISTSTVNLSFTTATGTPPPLITPEHFKIELSQSPVFDAGVTTIEPVTSTSQLVNSLGQGLWYWRVKRVDLAGNQSAFSAASTFLLDSEVPVIPTLSLPAHTATIGTDSITFDWSGTPDDGVATSKEYYYLHISKLANFIDFNTFSGFVYADSFVFPTSQLIQSQTYYWRVKGLDSAGFASNYSPASSFLFRSFICGDVDGSNSPPDIADLTYMIEYLFLGGPAPDPFGSGAVECDDIIDISDLTVLIDFLFISLQPLCCD